MLTLIDTQTLDHLLDPLEESLTPEMAHTLVSLRANPKAQARLESLATRNSQGLLSAQEQAEYTSLIHVGAAISLVQAKARKALRSEGSR